MTRRCNHPGRPCPTYREQARYASSLDIACRRCGGTYTVNDYEPHSCPAERVTPLRIAGMVVFVLIGFAAIAYPLAILGQAVAL